MVSPADLRPIGLSSSSPSAPCLHARPMLPRAHVAAYNITRLVSQAPVTTPPLVYASSPDWPREESPWPHPVASNAVVRSSAGSLTSSAQSHRVPSVGPGLEERSQLPTATSAELTMHQHITPPQTVPLSHEKAKDANSVTSDVAAARKATTVAWAATGSNLASESQATDAITFNEELLRLRASLARERAERHALAARVNALARTQQDLTAPSIHADSSGVAACLMTKQSNSSLATAHTDIVTPASSSTHFAKEPWLGACASSPNSFVSGLSEESSTTHEPEMTVSETTRTEETRATGSASGTSPPRSQTDTSHESPVQPLTPHDPGAHKLGEPRAHERPQLLQQPREGLLANKLERLSRTLASSGRTQDDRRNHDGMYDTMLEDAQTILAELELDLHSSNQEQDVQNAGPVHVLAFYRKKCLELASKVHRRDSEVVLLRRALTDACGSARTAASPSPARSRAFAPVPDKARVSSNSSRRSVLN